MNGKKQYPDQSGAKLSGAKHKCRDEQQAGYGEAVIPAVIG